MPAKGRSAMAASAALSIVNCWKSSEDGFFELPTSVLSIERYTCITTSTNLAIALKKGIGLNTDAASSVEHEVEVFNMDVIRKIRPFSDSLPNITDYSYPYDSYGRGENSSFG